MRPVRPHTCLSFAALIDGRASRLRAAFTMAEMVIVIMIMGIMAAAGAPAFLNSLIHHRVEAAAHRLKLDFELARHTARLTSATQSITFTGSAYALSAATADFDDPNARYSVDLAVEPYEIATLKADFSGDEAVSFDGYGTPSSGGSVIITCGGHSSTIALDAVTGEVTIQSIHSVASADANGG